MGRCKWMGNPMKNAWTPADKQSDHGDQIFRTLACDDLNLTATNAFFIRAFVCLLTNRLLSCKTVPWLALSCLHFCRQNVLTFSSTLWFKCLVHCQKRFFNYYWHISHYPTKHPQCIFCTFVIFYLSTVNSNKKLLKKKLLQIFLIIRYTKYFGPSNFSIVFLNLQLYFINVHRTMYNAQFIN